MNRRHQSDIKSPAVRQRKRWYGLARWKKLRAEVLAGDPLCAICWQRPATQADHVEHRPDNSTFWDRANLRPTCVECNNRAGAKARHARDRLTGASHAGGGWVASSNGRCSTALRDTETDTTKKNDRIPDLFSQLKETQNAEPNQQ